MINEIYSAADGKKFRIINVVVQSGETWINYQRLDTGQQYNCLAPAFYDRFTRELS